MTINNQAPFINFGGGMTFPPPYQQKNARIFAFLLDGKSANMQALCNQLFNTPSQGTQDFRPLVSDVLLTFVEMEIYSLQPEARAKGKMIEKDCIFWMTTVNVKEKLGIPWAQYLALSPAYIYVSNPFAMITGRDVIGYPKNFANIELPDSFFAPQQDFSAEILAFSEYGPEQQATWQNAVTATLKTPPSADKPKTLWKNMDEALHEIGKLIVHDSSIVIPGMTFLENTIEAFLKKEILQIFMRQFPDTTVDKAVYQSVQLAKTKINGFRSAGLLDGTYEVNIANLASEPVSTDLGVTLGTQTPKLSFYIDFDFIVEAPTILHKTP